MSVITNKPSELVLSDKGQMFARVDTIREAVFDVIDSGHNLHVTEHEDWAFSDRGDDEEIERRSDFVRAVVARIAELQSPPHDGIRLENLCPRHRRKALPAATEQICSMCRADWGK